MEIPHKEILTSLQVVHVWEDDAGKPYVFCRNQQFKNWWKRYYFTLQAGSNCIKWNGKAGGRRPWEPAAAEKGLQGKGRRVGSEIKAEAD